MAENSFNYEGHGSVRRYSGALPINLERIRYAQLIRYADDFVVCFEKEAEAIAFGDDLRMRIGEFGLTVSEEKSKTIEFGRRACTKAKRDGRKCETFDNLWVHAFLRSIP